MTEELKSDEIQEEEKPEETSGEVAGEQPGDREEVVEETPEGEEAEESPEEAKEGEQDEEPGKEKEKESYKPKVSKAEKRINQLTRQKMEERERADRLERENEALKSGKGLPPVASDFNEPEPSEDDFESTAEYTKALTGWTVRKEKAEDAARTEQETATRERKNAAEEARIRGEAVVQSFTERVEEIGIKNKHADFDEVIADETPYIGNDEGSATLRSLVLESDFGPEIAYHFGKNPDEAQQLLDLPIKEQLRAIFHLESSLQVSIGKKESGAPAPVETLEGDDQPVIDRDKIPTKQWIANEKKRVQAQGRRY